MKNVSELKECQSNNQLHVDDYMILCYWAGKNPFQVRDDKVRHVPSDQMKMRRDGLKVEKRY